MQIFKTIWWYGLLGVITGAAFFCMMFLQIHAEEIAGEEARFTHTHTDSCYGMVTVSCEGSHTFRYGCIGSEMRWCSTCNAETKHITQHDQGFCSTKNKTWVYNGRTDCSVCGTLHSAGWDGYPYAEHNYQVRGLICKIPEGSAVLGIQVIADNTPTNTGVTLHIRKNILNEDLINRELDYDWGSDTLNVTENGTYSVTAADSMGKTVTASVTISCIDKISPVINTISYDKDSVTQNSVKAVVTASDKESGLHENAYSTDGGATWSSQSSYLVAEGSPLRLMVRDRAGNVTEKSISRSDFPYPPVPTPVPVPTPAPTPLPSDTTASAAASASAPAPVPAQKPAAENNTAIPSKTALGSESEKEGRQTAGSISGSSAKPEAGDTIASASEKAQSADGKTSKEADVSGGNAADSNTASGGNAADSNTASGGNAADSDTVSAGNAWTETQIVQEPDKPLNYKGGTDKAAVKAQKIISKEDGQTRTTAFSSIKRIASKKRLLAAGKFLAGAGIAAGMVAAGRFLWMYSVILYCYDGGDEYRKLGVFFLHKKEQGMELYLPEYLTDATDILRYRLHLKKGLVKRKAGRDLVVLSEDGELRRPLEECVDFVL